MFRHDENIGQPGESGVVRHNARESDLLLNVLKFGELTTAIHWLDLPGITRYEMEFAIYGPDQRVTLSFPSPFLRSAPATVELVDGEVGTAASRSVSEIISYESAFKLELKAFNNAKLYYTIQNYKSASIALKSVIDKHPNTVHKEEAMYLIVKSDYLLAENSIESKKMERYEQTIKSYTNFVVAFPESRFRPELERYNRNSMEKLRKLNK